MQMLYHPVTSNSLFPNSRSVKGWMSLWWSFQAFSSVWPSVSLSWLWKNCLKWMWVQRCVTITTIKLQSSWRL